MTTLIPSINLGENSLPQLVRQTWRINKPLSSLVITCAVLTALGVVGILIDPRSLLGQAIWVKPTKFAISIVIYGATMLAMFGSMPERPRWANWLLTTTGLMLWAEIIVIVVQAARGQTSHYNMTTPFNAAMWSIMGISIFILFGVTVIGALLLMLRKKPFGDFAGTRTVTWSLKLGLLVTVLAGYSVGTLMPTPTDSQMARMEAGEAGAMDIIGAHTVGADDGGVGLPFLGWSTTHGDLRVGHFFGLHALQAIPLLGIFVARRREQWLGAGHRSTLVTIGAFAYAGFVGLVTWQAQQAEPLIAPSATTMSAFAGLIGITAAAVGLTLLHGYRSKA